MMNTSDFDYELPSELIAQAPVSPRDSSRLMVVERDSGLRRHIRFTDLPDLLHSGDLLVVNDTRVIPARFDCWRTSGGRLEALLLHQRPDGVAELMLKGAGRCRVGERLKLADAEAGELELTERCGGGLWRARLVGPAPLAEVLERLGRTPLPPYIRRERSAEDAPDRRDYQTVYADRPGAAAAPTAGLHFTRRVLDALAERGVGLARVTLHVGLGTFAPVKCDDPAEHPMHAEWYEIGEETAGAVRRARAEGRRVVAVGTTSVRVLETAAAGGEVSAGAGWTDIFIRPPGQFRAVDALLTNFHLPRSTLLMLVAAFCSPGTTDGVATALDAYAEAVDLRYRFYSYGDAMLIV
jgi:S-adenosylmethionine:tRNA ribosyltransferase-isomerase